jgi:hypothetical protein
MNAIVTNMSTMSTRPSAAALWSGRILSGIAVPPAFLNKILLLALFASIGSASAFAQEPSSPGSKLRPGMLVWNVGIDGTEGPSHLVETITTSSWEGHDTWRVTHYPQDPTNSKINDYDLYELDRRSLAPLRSVSNREDGYLDLRFEETGVTIHSKTRGEGRSEHIDLGSAVRPEGPGLTAFVATLPLGAGYQLNYDLVDRWNGRDKGRIKKMKLVVKSRGSIQTAMGQEDSYEVLIRAEDGSFEIRESVLAQGLHWPLRMTYIRGAAKVTSEVVAIAVSAQ